MLWNDVLSNEVDDRAAIGDAKIHGKRFRVLKRSLVRATFALLEGYLNGLAIDILATRDHGGIGPGDLERLKESGAGGHKKFQTLKSKLLHYPRIALDREAPLFQEGDFPAMAVVLTKERELREAIVHPTPRLKEEREQQREQSYFEIETSGVQALVDASIAVIRRIDQELGGILGTVGFWLFERNGDGRYPPKKQKPTTSRQGA